MPSFLQLAPLLALNAAGNVINVLHMIRSATINHNGKWSHAPFALPDRRTASYVEDVDVSIDNRHDNNKYSPASNAKATMPSISHIHKSLLLDVELPVGM